MVSAPDSTSTAASLREKAEPVIAEATRRLVAEFQPEQVWLFGSYAWGEPTVDSDLDFAVVVSESSETPLTRAQRAHGCLSKLDAAMDILVPTRAEFIRYRNTRPSLNYRILREGRLLHPRSDDPEGAGEECPESPPSRHAEIAQTWIQKAARSLAAANVMGSGGDNLIEGAAFHCQQASEQSLKAFLAMQDQPILKSHSSEALISECAPFNRSFRSFAADAALLDFCAASYRNPGDLSLIRPTRAEFTEALAAAQRIYDFVLSLLPQETHPL